MTGDTSNALDIRQSLGRNGLPFDNCGARQPKAVGNLGQHPALLFNQVHAVHASKLTTGKQSRQADLLTHGIRPNWHNSLMEIGDRVRLARLQAGLNQRQLAAASEVSSGMIGQIESHTKMPGRETMTKIAAATGMSVSYLLGESAGAEPEPPKMDRDALTLLKLWHGLSPGQKKTHLDLFRESVRTRKRMEREIRAAKKQGADAGDVGDAGDGR